MKKSRFTDSQVITILKQAEAGTPVPELCREHGMSTFSVKIVVTLSEKCLISNFFGYKSVTSHFYLF